MAALFRGAAMAIIGGHPESGVRIQLERPFEGGPPWRYDGTALTPTMRFVVRAEVSATGEVNLELDYDPPPGKDHPRDPTSELELRIKTMIRAAHKHAQQDAPGSPPPRHIQRWRGSSTTRLR